MLVLDAESFATDYPHETLRHIRAYRARLAWTGAFA